MVAFFLNGLAFATWASRIPEVRRQLELSNGRLGLLLLTISIGSLLTLPTSGALINRFGASRVVGLGVHAAAIGLVLAVIGAGGVHNFAIAASGLVLYGIGTGLWDVAMNVEGTAVERELGRTIMPTFHALFSLGTVAGAGVGAAATALGVSLITHIAAMATFAYVVAMMTIGGFLPTAASQNAEPRTNPLRAWLEPRVILIGLMVFAFAITEGTANDWLAVALVDGYAAPEWLGVAGFGVFVCAMTAGRVLGSALLDRWGRLPMLWSTISAAVVGVLLIVFGVHSIAVFTGIVLWGLGASLGFPVGISAAADDPVHAAVRVSVVSTIAYLAFLAGPPLLGLIADQVGTLHALLVVAALLLPSALFVPASRRLTDIS